MANSKTNQQLIAQVRDDLVERQRVRGVRRKHSKQRHASFLAEMELLISDFLAEGYDLTNPKHLALLCEVVERKYTPPEEPEYGTHLTF